MNPFWKHGFMIHSSRAPACEGSVYAKPEKFENTALFLRSRLLTALYFRVFCIQPLSAPIESRENWTPVQNGEYDWVGGEDGDK